jgi:hypothetical protein
VKAWRQASASVRKHARRVHRVPPTLRAKDTLPARISLTELTPFKVIADAMGLGVD